MTKIPSEGSVTLLYLLGSVKSSIPMFCSNCHDYWVKLISTPWWQYVLPGGKRPFYNTRLGESAFSQEVKTTHGHLGYFHHLSNKTASRSNLREERDNWLTMEWRAWRYGWVHSNENFWLAHNLADFEAELRYDFQTPSLGVYISARKYIPNIPQPPKTAPPYEERVFKWFTLKL